MSNILLITATVTPPSNAIDLRRSDASLRLGDYISALTFYIRLLENRVFDSIVFSENSNSDISELRKLAQKSAASNKIEFISFYGLDYPVEYGRGYGELKLIEYTMRKSAIIIDAKSSSIIWKVTGRYIIENIEKLISPKTDAVMVCHCRNYPTRWVEMYFMGWIKSAYNELFIDISDDIKENNKGVPAEKSFRLLVDRRSRKMRIQRRFCESPKVKGIRGWDNVAYERQTFKRIARALVSRVIPWIWL